MENSFGNRILSLYTMIEGKILSYSYSNSEIPTSFQNFQMLFRQI